MVVRLQYMILLICNLQENHKSRLVELNRSGLYIGGVK